MDSEILAAAKILWEYLKLGQPPVKSDCVIAMGSHDLRVAQYAAELVVSGWAPLLVCSGGLGRLTQDIWQESEAAKFARIATEAGIPQAQILIEDRSTNTSENILFSKDLLQKIEIPVQSAILVHKPYMERRAFATAKRYWPELEISVSSPQISFEEYPNADIGFDELIAIMVGDFQRVLVYPEKGFQIKQDIPENVNKAFSYIIKHGYTRFLIAG